MSLSKGRSLCNFLTYSKRIKLNEFIRRTLSLSTSNPTSEDLLKETPLKRLVDESSTIRKEEEEEWATLSRPVPDSLWDNIEAEGLDPKDTSIIMFPGQGTHYLGMGQNLKKFPRARDLYNLAKGVTGVDLLAIDNRKELEKHAQLSIVVHSLACLEKLREERPSALETCVATTGFSLGEITALIFAGSIPFEQGLKLVNMRAAAMEAASVERPGGMVTVLYGADTNIRKVCAEVKQQAEKLGERDAVCGIANYLYPQCVVLAATDKALQYLTDNGKKLGIRRMKRLAVSGPFHSEAMEKAVEPFAAALNLCDITDPKIRVISSVTGKQYFSAKNVHYFLPKQIVSPVKWQQLLQLLYIRKKGMEFPKTYEVGPGQTLRTTLRLVNAAAWDNSLTINENS